MTKHETTTSTKHPTSNLLFQLMMCICIVVWALAFPFIKLALSEVSFVTLTILRFTVVCIISLIFIGVQPQRFSRLHKQDIIPIFLLGFVGVMMYHFGLNYGEQYISAGAASLIIATIPVFTILFATVFLKERLSALKIIGVVLALTGVGVISIWGTENASLEIQYVAGAVAVLIAAIVGSTYTIAGKKLLTRYSPLSLTLYAMLLGSLVLIPSAFLTPTFLSEVRTLSLNTWCAIIFLGVCSTIIGYVIWYVALERRTASEISVYLYGIPVLSTIISFFMFNDLITPLFLLGGCLVLGGLILVNKKTKKI